MKAGILKSVTNVGAANSSTVHRSKDLRTVCPCLQDTMSNQAELLTFLVYTIVVDPDANCPSRSTKLVRDAELSEVAGQMVSQLQPNTAEAQTSSDKTYLQLSSYKSFKLYQRNLVNVWCFKVRDASFFGITIAWKQLNQTSLSP